MAEEVVTRKEVTPESRETAQVQRLEPARSRVLSPFAEMDQLFERLFPRDWMRPFRDWPAWGELGAGLATQLPRVDMIDRDDEIVVRAELPGVAKDDIDVSLTDTTLTLRATTRKEEREEKGDYVRSEIHQGAFSRTLALPAEIDVDGARASFRDGLLELTLPKLARAQRRSIPVE